MIWWQLCLVLLFWQKLIYSQNYDILVEKIYCKSDPNYICQNVSCTTLPVKRFVSNLSTECYLTEPVDNFLIRITFYYKLREYRKFLIDVEEDYCGYLSDTNVTRVVNFFGSQLLTKTNVHSCPINMSHIWIRNLQIDTRNTPPFIPIGQYRMDLNCTNKKKTKVYQTFQIYFSIRSKGLYKGEMG